MAKEQIQCPNCKQYKIVTNRQQFLKVGLIGIVMSSFFLIFIITIPLLIFSIPIILVGFIGAVFAKGGVCSNCHFKMNPIKAA